MLMPYAQQQQQQQQQQQVQEEWLPAMPPPPPPPPLSLTRVSTASAAPAELRRHRLERHVARLRVSRAAPTRLQLPPLQESPPPLPAAVIGAAAAAAAAADTLSAAPQQAGEDSGGSEAFVPRRAAPTESKRLQQAAARDRAWIADFWVELLLIFLGLNFGPLLYYYLVQRAPPVPSEGGDGAVFGVERLDYWLQHLLAPLRCVQHWCKRDNLPAAVPAFARASGPLIALLASLGGTALLLRYKAAVVQAVRDVPRMRAATATHVVVAWSWLGAPWTFFQAFSWATNFSLNLVCFLLLVFFSHTFAGVAQGAALGYSLYLLSGLGKWFETKKFQVLIPDPDKDDGVAAGSGGGDGGDGDKAAAAARSGRGGVAGGWGGGDDFAIAAAAPDDGAVADGGGAAQQPPEWWWAAAEKGGVSGGGPADDNDAVPPSGPAAALFDAAAVPGSNALLGAGATAMGATPPAAATDDDGGDEDDQPQESQLLRGANRGAFQLLRVLNATVLAVFGAVKLVRAARLRTGPGRAFGLTASGLILVGSLGVGALELRKAAIGDAAASPPIPIHYYSRRRK